MLRELRRLLGRKKSGPIPDYDAQACAVMDRVLRKDSATIDVGAHSGTVLAELVRRAPDGEHFAFEPLPGPFEKMRARYGRRAGVRLFQAAVAERAGRASFQHVTTRPTYSGLRLRRMDRPGERVQTIEVDVVRLDDVVPADVPVALMKIDVEGGELGVLEGARGLLARHRPVVVFEHGLGGADHYGTRPEQVFDLLAGVGLRVSLMSRFLGGEAPYDRAAFVAEFERGAQWYFVAYP